MDAVDTEKNVITDSKDHWKEFSLLCLQQSAIHLRVIKPRSLTWAIMLHALPSPTQNSTEDTNFMSSLKACRNEYQDMKTKFTNDPRNALGDDPLSQHDESLWNQYFCDIELKNLILQDVTRTYPDEKYFKETEVQDMMVRILFVWARAYRNIGYRQGMHEILAPLLFELHTDRKNTLTPTSNFLSAFLQEEYLEADSFMLFNSVMKGLERFYSTGDVIPTSSGRLPTSKAVHSPNTILKYLEIIREEYLMPADPELAEHIHKCRISLELFGIRWLRLLFGREFPRTEVPVLWSYLFVNGPLLPSIPYIIVAMLISMRNILLESEPDGVLSTLMRPMGLSVDHVIPLSLHLSEPSLYTRPVTPPPIPKHHKPIAQSLLEESGTSADAMSVGGEGVAEGADVARELAALALLRAQLPPAAAALAKALGTPPPTIAHPLAQILQLSALLQCRNHALVDVETALEAAESQSSEKFGRRQLVPVAMVNTHRHNVQVQVKPANKIIKEVPLKVFYIIECDSSFSKFPCLDPLKLRTN